MPNAMPRRAAVIDAQRAEPKRVRLSSALPRAEGVGFEPTVTCATMVFETIRFGRSRIPPGRDDTGVAVVASPLAPLREEVREQRTAFVGEHARHDLGLVVEA